MHTVAVLLGIMPYVLLSPFAYGQHDYLPEPLDAHGQAHIASRWRPQLTLFRYDIDVVHMSFVCTYIADVCCLNKILKCVSCLNLSVGTYMRRVCTKYVRTLYSTQYTYVQYIHPPLSLRFTHVDSVW